MTLMIIHSRPLVNEGFLFKNIIGGNIIARIFNDYLTK